MSTERTKRRVVDKQRYMATMLEKAALFSGSLSCLGVGFLFCTISLLLCAWTFASIAEGEAWDVILGLIVSDIVFGLASFGSFWLGVRQFNAASRMERVELLTRHNTGDLLEVETLVRGSDRPASDPQAELLRAAKQQSDTAPEQLLRATPENRQDA